MAVRTADGSALGEHYAALERMGKVVLRSPALPPAGIPVWNAFARLSYSRSSNGFGANPIPYTEIEAFCRLTGTDLSPWEVETITALDALFRESVDRLPEKLTDE